MHWRFSRNQSDYQYVLSVTLYSSMKGSCLAFFLFPMQCLLSGSLFISLFAAAFNFFLSVPFPSNPSLQDHFKNRKDILYSHVVAGLHQGSMVKYKLSVRNQSYRSSTARGGGNALHTAATMPAACLQPLHCRRYPEWL